MRTGQKVIALPAGIVTTVKQIWTYEGVVEEAFCPQSVTLVLEHDIDISRGSMVIGTEHLPGASTNCRRRFAGCTRARCSGDENISSNTRPKPCRSSSRISSTSSTWSRSNTEPEPPELAMNDIGEIRLRSGEADWCSMAMPSTGSPVHSS